MKKGNFRKQLLTPNGLWDAGAVILRVIAGIIIIRFGLELTAEDKMSGYKDWLTDLGFPFPSYFAYMGKTCELVGGTLLVLGLFTRLATIVLVPTMFVVCFVMGKPDVLSGDLSFMLLLVFLHFLFTGPGSWSLDHWLFRVKKVSQKN
jgi:putative oxidoreductase